MSNLFYRFYMCSTLLFPKYSQNPLAYASFSASFGRLCMQSSSEYFFLSFLFYSRHMLGKPKQWCEVHPLCIRFRQKSTESRVTAGGTELKVTLCLTFGTVLWPINVVCERIRLFQGYVNIPNLRKRCTREHSWQF